MKSCTSLKYKNNEILIFKWYQSLKMFKQANKELSQLTYSTHFKPHFHQSFSNAFSCQLSFKVERLETIYKFASFDYSENIIIYLSTSKKKVFPPHNYQIFSTHRR